MTRLQSAAWAVMVSALGGTFMRCDTAEPEPDKKAPVLQILAPKAGAKFKVADTIRIVTECNYDSVAGNLNAVFSPDSGKNWELISSAPHRAGVVRDTFLFQPKEYGIAAGQSLKVGVWEYGATGRKVELGFIQVE